MECQQNQSENSNNLAEVINNRNRVLYSRNGNNEKYEYLQRTNSCIVFKIYKFASRVVTDTQNLVAIQ